MPPGSNDAPDAASAEAATPPLFSIVTIVFNDLNGLVSTKQSIDAQTFREFEWIVIDGASTDGTAEYLREHDHAESSRPLRQSVLVSEPDKGIYDAMNKGLARACGLYVVFMNAGDKFADSAVLAKVAASLEECEAKGHEAKRQGADFLYGDAMEFDGQSLLLKPARDIRAIRYGMFTHHQAMLYRRAFLLEHRLRYDLSFQVAGDYALTAAMYTKGCTSLRLPLPICIFERGGKSQKQEAAGRREVLLVQKSILGLGPGLRSLNHLRFSLSSLVRGRLPALYDRLRFRRSP